MTEFSSVQNLYIFGERDKTWLSNTDDSLAIDDFFININSIAEYEITIPGDTQEIEFYESWLKSLKNSKQDIHLIHRYNESKKQNYLNFKSNAVVTFYGGSKMCTPQLKYSMMISQKSPDINDKLRVLDDQIISCLKLIGSSRGLELGLKAISSKERTYLKQIVVLDCGFEAYTPQAITTILPQQSYHNT